MACGTPRSVGSEPHVMTKQIGALQCLITFALHLPAVTASMAPASASAAVEGPPAAAAPAQAAAAVASRTGWLQRPRR